MGNQNSDRAALFLDHELFLNRFHARHYRRHTVKEESGSPSLLTEASSPQRCVVNVGIDL